jgi:hypothetical protein
MTLGQYVERRMSLMRILSLLWFVVPIALIFAFPTTAQTSGTQWLLLSYGAMWAICAVIALRTVCPRCHGSLFWQTIKAARLWFGGKIEACPHCHVRFDEPIEPRR